MAVVVRHGLHDLPRPEDVVCDQHRPAVHQRAAAVVAHQHPVVIGVFAFVAVDEREVELPAQFRDDVECRADVERDLAAVGAAGEVRTDELLLLVVHLHGVQFGALLQPCGHRECRVTREGSDFERPPGPQHPHEHLQQTALNVPRDHSRGHGTQVGFAVEFVQQCLFGFREIVDVSLERVHYSRYIPCLLNWYEASITSSVSACSHSRHSRVNSRQPVPLAVTMLPSRTACRSS